MAVNKLVIESLKRLQSYFYNFEPNFDDGILKKHNIEVYKKIMKGLTRGNKVVFEQATGTGKTYVSLKFLHDHARGKRVLVVSPSNAIRDSFLETYQNVLGADFDCSLELSLYQGLDKVKNNHYDIIMFDEAHRLGAKTWGQNAEELIKNNPNAIILGMSATLDRPDKADVLKFFDGKKPVSSITLVQALEMGILPNPDYTLAKVDFEDDEEYIDSSIRDFNEKLKNASPEEKDEIKAFLKRLKEAKKEIYNSDEISDIFYEEFNTDELKQGKFIVFCPSGEDEDENSESLRRMKVIMKQSSKWFEQISGIKKIKKYSVYSKLGRERNKLIIKNFERDDSKALKLLFSINMLNEGLHVHDIDGVIMLRNTSSRIIYLQQLGRALSVGHKQKPKIFDLVANLNYVDVLDFQSLAKEINKGMKKRGSHGDGEVNSSDTNWENSEFTLTLFNFDKMKLIDELKENIFDYNHRLDFEYEDFKARIIKWKNDKGNLNITQKTKDKDGYPIGQKIQNIKQGIIKITDTQTAELIALGLDLTIKDRSFDYEDFKARIIKWKNDKGNLNITQKTKDKDGYPIGQKISSIKKGDIKLTDSQKAELIALGLDLTIKKSEFQFEYEDFKARIIKWKKRKGKLDIKYNDKDEDGYPIGQKISFIKQKHGGIKITDDQRAELIALGLDLTLKKSEFPFDYEDFKARIIKWRNDKGDLNIKYNDTVEEDDYPIGQKIRSIKHGDIKLTDSQKAELIALGVDLTIKDRSFDYEDFKARIIKWKNDKGNLNIKYNDIVEEDSYPIGQKIRSIKSGNIKLTSDQIADLIALGVDLMVKDRSFNFEDFKARIIKWKNDKGNLNIKQRDTVREDGYPIGQKIAGIKQGDIKLTDSQIAELIALGVDLTVKRRNEEGNNKEEGLGNF